MKNLLSFSRTQPKLPLGDFILSEIKRAIGLMSGTSMDGIDVALVTSDGKDRVERGANRFFSYSPSIRNMLESTLEEAKNFSEPQGLRDVAKESEAAITSLHVEAVREFLADCQLNASDVDLIGFHGQTIMHRPDLGWTLQLGDGKRLAHETGITTVFDMRRNDMAHGGQGAPLVPVYHRAISQSLSEDYSELRPVVFVNIGGIANITYIGEELLAFDVGPGNALIDQWVQKHVGISHDDGGRIAAEGIIDNSLVAEYLNDPFFEKSVPKSLDRGDFAIPPDNSGTLETVARSLARVTAESIFKSVEHMPENPQLWIICGGGRHNPYIMTDLKEVSADYGSRVISAEEGGFDGDAMEAEAWGYLAIRALYGLPLTYPKTTGCTKPVTGGVLAQPNHGR